jgi:ABC-type polysaccharide/polyol phosphate export permease
MNPLATAWRHRELLWNLAGRDLKSRYKGSLLGFLWTVLSPLFMAVIYIFFLRLLGGRGLKINLADIIIGVFAWQFTVQSVNSGLNAFTGNANLVKKVFFPRLLLPASVVLSSLVNFLLTLAVQLPLVVFLLWRQHEMLSIWTLAVPVVILYHTFFNLLLALTVSAANVYFRDTSHLVGLGLSAWFFVSPVMYPLTLVRDLAQQWPWVEDLYQLNPLTVIITAYRALQTGAPLVLTPAALVGGLWPLVAAVLIFRAFDRAQRNFSDLL